MALRNQSSYSQTGLKPETVRRPGAKNVLVKIGGLDITEITKDIGLVIMKAEARSERLMLNGFLIS